MAQDSSIAWTDKTWNPTRGCRRVSPGCENCYAEGIAYRFSGQGLSYEGLATLGLNGPRWTGKAQFIADALDAPLSWREPKKIFVDSMSDLFYEGFSDEEIAAVFGVMAACPQHTFQVLTKRPERAAKWFSWASRHAASANLSRGMSEAAYCLAMAQRRNPAKSLTRNVTETCARPWPLPNVWIGASIEDQQRAEERIPHLLKIPAVVRFLSVEPQLGPIDFDLGRCDTHDREYIQNDLEDGEICGECAADGYTGELSYIHWLDACASPTQPGINWVIVGGESGRKARPFDIAWARSAIKDCRNAGVAVFVKQLGARAYDSKVPGEVVPDEARLMAAKSVPGSVYVPGMSRISSSDPKNDDMDRWPADIRIREFPKV